MGYHSIIPLRIKKHHNLKPGAPFIEMPDAKRGKSGIPVPLIGIQPISRHSIAAAIVHLDNPDSFFDSSGHIHLLFTDPVSLNL